MLTKYCAVYWILPDIYIFKKKKKEISREGCPETFSNFKM